MQFKDQLYFYYDRIYPVNSIYKFLHSTSNREISFTLANNVYIRHLTFHTGEELKASILHKLPEKIDFGCIYTTRPDISQVPLKKELIFDVDLSDYTRTCCTGKNICNECIILVKVAANIIDYVIRNVFNYNKIMYVFSGGRGIHVWVCDEEAMILTNQARKAIVDFFNVNTCKKVHGLIVNNWDMFVKLDKNVSVDIKHLLKGPFSVHPTTKNVSVPMSLEMLQGLSVEVFVKLESLVEENNSLDLYIQYFEEFVGSLKYK